MRADIPAPVSKPFAPIAQGTSWAETRSQCGTADTCANRKIASPLIEKLVVDALPGQAPHPKRVNAILAAAKFRRDERQASADRRISELAKQVVDTEERL